MEDLKEAINLSVQILLRICRSLNRYLAKNIFVYSFISELTF